MNGWVGVSSVLGDRYRLDAPIGRGGMAEVWRGHDLVRDLPVAVKVFAAEGSDPSMRARFAQEARTAARVVHPNVVSVYDVGEHEGRPFLVMELLSGRSLAEELAARGPLEVDEVRRLVGQVAVALDAAHRAGVVHRDIKPANLHLTDGGQVKVVDFGIARLADEAAGRLTAVGMIVGTAAYMSPDQIMGRPGDAASDMYALGCVCYELLCGHPPFAGSSAELVFQHIQQPPPPPRRFRPELPADLEALVLALLEKEPSARPTAGEVIARTRSAPPPPPGPARAGDTALLDVSGAGFFEGGGAASGWPPQAYQGGGAPTQGHTAHPTAWPPTSAYGGHLAYPDGGPTAHTSVTPGPWSSGNSGNSGRPKRGGMSRRKGAMIAAGAVVPVLAVVWLASPSSTSTPDAAGAAPTSAATTPAPVRRSPSATPRPTPSVTPTPPAPSPSPTRVVNGPLAWLAGLASALAAQEQQGGIDSDTAEKVRDKIEEMREKIADGKPEKVRKKLRELSRTMNEAQRKGRLASSGPLVDYLNRSGLLNDHRR
ncbi:protein kinase domain-containing protein [Microtetraspora malaysiensis]|uniref:serine/threonine-protein kinase n=1 Tax=Microtetraspora malaysiensis TaxID=161358 RepID=UPI003D8BEDF4